MLSPDEALTRIVPVPQDNDASDNARWALAKTLMKL
jgi:hypothetical protein